MIVINRPMIYIKPKTPKSKPKHKQKHKPKHKQKHKLYEQSQIYNNWIITIYL